jgi:hypothetical protein
MRNALLTAGLFAMGCRHKDEDADVPEHDTAETVCEASLEEVVRDGYGFQHAVQPGGERTHQNVVRWPLNSVIVTLDEMDPELELALNVDNQKLTNWITESLKDWQGATDKAGIDAPEAIFIPEDELYPVPADIVFQVVPEPVSLSSRTEPGSDLSVLLHADSVDVATLAQTELHATYNCDTGTAEIVGADVYIMESTLENASRSVLRPVISHEVGHAAEGLTHPSSPVDESGTPNLMAEDVDRENPPDSDPNPNTDVLGVRCVYGNQADWAGCFN